MFESFDKSNTGVLAMSGGLDSFVLATWLAVKAKKTMITGVFLDYLQSNAGATLNCVEEQLKYINKTYKVETDLQVISGFHWHRLGNIKEGFTKENVYNPEKSDKENKKFFVSGRNSLIALSIMSLADVLGVTEAWMAIQLDEPEWPRVQEYLTTGTKDITPQWVDRMNLMGEVSFQTLVRLRVPFLDMRWDKKDVINLGRQFNTPFDITYSCRYYPPCGECQQCIIRNKYL